MTKCPRRSSTRPAGDVGDIVVTVVVGLGASVGTGISVGDDGDGSRLISVGVEGNSPKRLTLNESIRMTMTGSMKHCEPRFELRLFANGLSPCN